MISIGVLLAVCAMLGWGIGDFLIQRSIRRVGIWESLFLVTILGAFIFFPFVIKDLPDLFANKDAIFTSLLLGAGIIMIAAIFDFIALNQGKLAIVEPLFSIEIPIAGLAAFIFLGEKISAISIGLIVLLIFGLSLTSLRKLNLKWKHIIERGALFALGAGIFMGLTNFMFGLNARASDAFLVNWFTDTFLALFSLGVIIIRKRFILIKKHLKGNLKTVIGMNFFDRLAWLAFTQAMILAPIAIVTSLSECYIIIAVLLGLKFNREKLNRHQIFGIFIAVAAAVALAASM